MRPLLAALFILASPAPVLAAPLPLDPLVDTALARHPAVAAARATTAAAEARVGVARAPYWPQVSANTSAARTTNVSPSQTATQPFLLTAGGLQIRQQLWDFGKTAAEADAAEATARAEAAEVAGVAVEVAFAVRRSYFDWAQARAAVAQAEVRMGAAEAVLAQARAFWKAGKRAKIEAVRAEADREAARAELVAARLTADQARRALAAALASDEPPPGEPTFPPLPAIADASLEALMQRARARHPVLVGATWRLEASRARAEGVARQGWPDLNADANFGLRARDEALGQNWSTGLSLSTPLFTGFAQTRQTEAARAEAAAAQAVVGDRLRTVRLAIEQAWLGVRGARERQPAAASLARAARETWRLAAGRYRAGVGSAVEVADARALLASAEAGEVRAEADVHRAVAELWRALGETGREDVR